MSRTVTLRLKDPVYETATLRYLEQEEYVDEFEMQEIRANEPLNKSITRGLEDAKERRGR